MTRTGFNAGNLLHRRMGMVQGGWSPESAPRSDEGNRSDGGGVRVMRCRVWGGIGCNFGRLCDAWAPVGSGGVAAR